MGIEKILNRIEATPTPQVTKVAPAYSGGLDSSLSVELLRRKYKAREIVPITIDVGQGEEEIAESTRKAKLLGIVPLLIDKKDEFTEQWIAKAIRANSDYLGYPVSTSMTRQIVARKVAEVAVEKGCDAITEGSSGKGNDQISHAQCLQNLRPRFENSITGSRFRSHAIGGRAAVSRVEHPRHGDDNGGR